MNTAVPAAEFPIDETLIKSLLQEQHPDLADLAISFLDSGWDNENYRLGDDLCVRLPRRAVGEELILTEQRILPIIKEKFDIGIPCPIRNGVPVKDYPWHWSVVPWFHGKTANLDRLDDDQAMVITKTLKTLHSISNSGASTNIFRSVPLNEKAEQFKKRMDSVANQTDLITDKHRNIWQVGSRAEINASKHLIHADLHHRNIIVNQGKLEAIIDWGDMAMGDPATDLGSLWLLFEEDAVRQECLNYYGADQATIHRAKTWALYFGLILVDTGIMGHKEHEMMGRQTLKNLATSNL